jgi:Flp pilus assembly protein TadG
MRNIKETRSDERGQIVVIVAFALVVLLLAAGLAIDGGTLLFNRRSMQNAADAAALAGARVLSQAMCDDTESNATDHMVDMAVQEFATRNGVVSAEDDIYATYVYFDNFNDVVQFSPPVIVGEGAVPSGASGVAVTTTFTQSTYFMGLVGTDESNTGATATAVTGPPFIVGGIRPFGVPLFTVQNMSVGDCFTLSFKNCDEDAPLGDPDGCYIYDDSGASIGQHRGWMNLGYVWRSPEATSWPRAVSSAPAASEMKELMCSGWDNTLWADCQWNNGCQTGDFIHAIPGTTASGIGELKHCPEVYGQQIFIPIYDLVPQYDEIDSAKPANAGAGGYYYHIVGFGGVRIQEQGTSQGASEIRACLDEVIMGQGQPSPNTGFGTDVCSTHTMVVTLWR